jgi:hypothetical protein
VGQVVSVRIALVEAAQLSHDVGGFDAIDQHLLHRVAKNLAAW